MVTKVFQSGESQAIHIPREMQTQEDEFVIKKYGKCYFLIPTDDPWALLRESIGQIDKDTPFEREQPLVSQFSPGEAG